MAAFFPTMVACEELLRAFQGDHAVLHKGQSQSLVFETSQATM